MGSLRFLSSIAGAVVICTGVILSFAVSPASADEACAAPAMYIAAHEDDTLLFQSPSLLQDIQSEHCVRTVFTTAGDAGRAQSYWGTREAGAEDAYAQMAGVANQWTDSVVTVNGHPIHLKTLKAKPSISIVYLRLPDGGTNGLGFPLYGNQSLMKLWNSEHQNEEKNLPEIISIKANDNSATYGYSDLITTLSALMASFGPQQVYTQNYTTKLIGADHPDHVATGLLVREASRSYGAAHRLVGFRDYETAGQPENVSGTLLGGKSAAFYKYGGHDSDACASEGACTGTEYAQWLPRQYLVNSTKFETTGIVANAGFTQLTEPNTLITLDGSGSSVETGKTAQYFWTQIGGPTVTLSSTVASKPTFTTPSHPTKLTFSLVVKDGTNTSKPDTVVIKAPSSDPTPTASAGLPQTVASGAKVTLDGSESWDPNSATLQYAWLQTGGPAVTLSGSSTATPSFTAPTGPTSVKFSLMVSNGNQTSAPSTVTVSINGTVPSFTSATSAPFTTSVAGSFKVTTTASPTAALTRTEGELPPGLSFTANGDGTATIAGTPTTAAAPAGGSQAYSINVNATNGEGSTVQTLTLNVTNPGTAPLFISGTSTGFTTGVAGSFTVSTTGDPLPTVTKSAGTLPPGVIVTTNANGTLTISGTPAAAAAEPGESQNYPLSFEAKSAAGKASQSFTLTVTNPGTPPSFSSAGSTGFTTGTAGSFTISTTGAPAAAIAKISGSLPPGLSLTDQGDGSAKISGTPSAAAAPAGQTQPYAIGLEAKNVAGQKTQTLTLNVTNPGTAPSFSSAASTAFTTGVAGSFTVTTSGAPSAAVTLKSGALPPGMTLTDQGDGSAKISGTPTAAAAPPGESQPYGIELLAKNVAGQNTQALTITVTNPGTPPSFSSAASTTFTTGVAGSFTVASSGNPTATVTKSAGTLPPGVIVTTNANGTLTISGTPAAAAAEPGESQNYPLSFEAKSAAGKASQSFTLTVTNPGTPPSFTSADTAAFTTGTTGSFTISTTGNPVATISKTVGTLPPGLTLVDQGNGTAKLSGTPTGAAAPAGESQEYEVTFNAQSLAGSAAQALTITVTNPGTPPSFTSTASTTFTTGVAGSFTVASSGNPTATVTKSAGTLPTGVSVTTNANGTLTISGTPAAAAAEPGKSQAYTLTFQAESVAGKASQSFTLTVTNPGTPPSFSSANSTGFTTGVAGSFTVTTSGAPSAAITLKSGTLPPGMTLTDQGDGSAKISGTPSAAAAPAGESQSYGIELLAKNVAGQKTQTLTITVTNPGTPPSFSSAGSTGFTTGTTGSFTISTTGNPVATISKTVGTLPPGLTLVDQGNGTAKLSGTPTGAAAPAGESQEYEVTLSAQSLAGQNTQTLTITVTNPGTAPAFTSGTSTGFTTGVAGSFTVTTTGAPAAAIAKISGSLPPGLGLTDQGDGSAKISGTPSAAAAPAGQTQPYAIGLEAKNVAGQKTQTLTLNVTNPGTAPTITSAASTAFTTGVAGSFTVTSSGAPSAAITLKSGTLPPGMTLTDQGDGSAKISGTPTAAAAPPGESQPYGIELLAKNVAGQNTQTLTITVTNPGTAPSFTSTASTTFTTGVAGSFTVASSGNPTATVTKSAGTLPTGVSVTTNANGTLTISGTPAAAAAEPGESQNYPLSFEAKSAAGKASQSFTLTVTNPGTAPAFTSGTSTGFTTGVAGSFTVTTTGAPAAAIAKISGSLPPGLGLTDQGDGSAKISGTPSAAAAPAGQTQPYAIGLEAKNVAGQKTQTLTLNVTNPGTAPTITSANSTGFTTGVAGSFTVTTSGSPTAALTLSGALPAGLKFTANVDGTATISGTAAAAAAEPGKSQSYTLTFKAKSAAGEVSQSFSLKVTNPGTPPSFTSVGSTTFTVGVAKTFTVSTTSNPVADLAQSGTLPPGLTFTDNGDGSARISGTATAAGAPPAANQNYPLTLEASSLSGSASQSFTLTVANPGTPPSFSSASSTGFTTGVAGSFKVTSTGDPTAALAWSGELPTGVSFTDNGDGTATISGTAPASAAPAASSKNYTLTFQAESVAGKASQSFTLTVTNPGTPPSFSSANSTGFTTGVAGSFKFTSTGNPTAALTQTGELPVGLSFSNKGDGTATISGTPNSSAAPPASSRNYPLTIKAANGAGNVTQAFTLTVTNPGAAPAITSANSASFTTGTTGSFKITSTGDPAATLSRVEGQLPSGLVFTNNGDGTATISGSAAAAAAPPASSQAYPIKVKAANGAGEATQTLTLTISNPGTGPAITSADTAAFTTGTVGSFKITSTGSPTATLSRTEGELPDGLSFSAKSDGTATISGTPVASAAPAAGSQAYPLKIKASSAAGSFTQTLTLTISNPGLAPAITSGTSASFTTGTAGSFKVVSSADPTASLSHPSGELPPGVSFTDNGNGTATIAGTPTAAAAPAGASQGYPITIKAVNGAGNASQSFTLTVSNPGTGPSITSAASTSFTTGVSGSFELTSTGAPAATLSHLSGELPAGVEFTAKANGKATLSGTPAATAASPGTSHDYALAIKATSSVGNVTQAFTLTVTNPGVGPAITSADTASFTTGVAGSFKITTSGDPSPGLNRQMGSLPDGLSFSDNGDGTATISGTPAAAAAGPASSQSYPLTIRAASAAGNTTQSLTLTVVNPGAGPVFTSASSTRFTAGSAKSFTVVTAGTPVAALAKSGALPAGLSFSDNGDGTATLSGTAATSAAAAGASRDYPLTFSASSGAGNASQSFTLTVVNTEVPVVTPPVEEPRPAVDPPKPPTPEPPVTPEAVKVTLSQDKVQMPIGRYSRRVVRVTAPQQALVTCKGKLPTGARCRVVAQHRVVIEASKAVKRTGTFHLTIHVDDQERSLRRRLAVQLLAPDDPALKLSRTGAQR